MSSCRTLKTRSFQLSTLISHVPDSVMHVLLVIRNVSMVCSAATETSELLVAKFRLTSFRLCCARSVAAARTLSRCVVYHVSLLSFCKARRLVNGQSLRFFTLACTCILHARNGIVASKTETASWSAVSARATQEPMGQHALDLVDFDLRRGAGQLPL